MQDIKNKIEAVLFTTGRFIDIEELAKLCGIGSIGIVKEALTALKQDYETRNSALYIVEQGNKFKLNIKKEYLYLTETLLTDSELDKPTQETLAVIAYKNPAMQSEIIKIRGNGAYEHIKILKELDFVISEPSGRSKILKLTNKFYDYFDVVEDQLKSKIQDTVDKAIEASYNTPENASTGVNSNNPVEENPTIEKTNENQN